MFLPDPIARRAFPLGGEAVKAVADAARASERLDSTPPRVATLGALARNLLRSESMASSRIEGVRVSHKRLARAAYQGNKGRRDHRATEVLGNVEAMERAIELGARAGTLRNSGFTVADIEDIHRALLRFTEDADIAGLVRDKQNWIGGNDYAPVGATYVPPPHEQVLGLLEDLCEFIERDDLAPIAQAAIAHAQFENIHPFADGNGRTGRALIYTVLRRRGEIENYFPPISLVLAATPKAYVGGLGAYSQGKVSLWCERFADAAARAAEEAERLAEAIEERQTAWLERLGQPRKDSAVRELVSALPAQPVIDVPVAQQLTGKSHVAAGAALRQLEESGILNRLNEKKWGRLWECAELLDLVGNVEKSMATPSGGLDLSVGP
ncbi:MAG: Fic family protein [Thermoleophilaceae bacterium]